MLRYPELPDLSQRDFTLGGDEENFKMTYVFDDRDPGDEDPKARLTSPADLAFIRRRIAEGMPKPMDYGPSPLRALVQAHLTKKRVLDVINRYYTPEQIFSDHDPGDEHQRPSHAAFVEWFLDFTGRVAKELGLPGEYLMPPSGSSLSYRWENGRLIVTQLVPPPQYIEMTFTIGSDPLIFGHDEG